MKKTLLAALCALVACGGDDSVDPQKVTFTYAAGTPVVSNSPEAYAAELGEFALAEAPALAEADFSGADPTGSSILTLAEDMASECMDSSGPVPASVAIQTRAARRVLAVARGDFQAAVSGLDDPACVRVSIGALSYDECSITDVDPYSGAETKITIDGSISRTGTVEAAKVAWDLRVVIATVEDTFRMTIDGHLQGDLDITPTSLVGATRSDTSVSASQPGQSLSAAVSLLADYDLAFEQSPSFCVTGGTLELRQVWTKIPQGATAEQTAPQGVLFSWNGCGNVNVSWGTR